MTASCPNTTDQPSLNRRDAGLTLLELLVVLTVLVALGGLIVPIFGSLVGDSQDQATRATMSEVAEVIVGPGGYAEVMQLARDASDSQFVGYGTGLPWPGPAETTTGGGSRADHPQLHYLFEQPTDVLEYDPVRRIGWRDAWLSPITATPYGVDNSANFTASYGDGDGRGGASGDDLAPIDGWGNPIVIQLPDETISGLAAEEEFQEQVRHVRLVSAGPNGVINTPSDELTPTASEKNDDLVLFLYREDPNP
ncbi:MAG: hypothetical protein AAF711_10515 [Planctomycetota bacterium]